MTIVCALTAQLAGPAVAGAHTRQSSTKQSSTKQSSTKQSSTKQSSTKQSSTKESSTKQSSRTRRCVGARSTAVDEASRRKATKVVLCLVNRQRRAQRVRPLRRDKRLAKAARQHSTAMVDGKYFSHASPAGDVLARAIRSGYVRRSTNALLGETLSWGIGSGATPEQLVASFMSSPSHRRTMLSKRFRDLGIGLVLGAPATNVDDSAATLTLNFGRR